MSGRDPLDAFESLRDAPPPPPFARIEAALDTPAGAFDARRRLLAVAATIAVAAGLALTWGLARRDSVPRETAGDSPLEIASPGLAPVGSGARANAPAALAWRDGSARVVLDADTILAPADADGASLLVGRAWFEVRPGRPVDRPFVVRTGQGEVRVKGTSFEVVNVPEAFTVQVVSGLVEVDGTAVPAGKRWRAGAVDDAEPFPGAWFRTPRLALDVPAAAHAGAPVALTLRFENPGHVPFDLQRRSGAPATLWLSVRAPDGAVHDVPLGADDGWEPGEPLPLGARETVRVPVRLLRPFASPGSYRVTALYRPSDGPSVRSDEATVEIR